MRQTYPCTDATRKVLSGHVPRMAEEMDVKDCHLYQILASHEPDFYGKFRRAFIAAVRAGAPVQHWLIDLESIQARYAKETPTIEHPAILTAGIGREFSEFIEAELAGQPIEKQIAECVDIITAATKKKVKLIAQKNDAHFGDKPISYKTRNEVKDRLNGRKG